MQLSLALALLLYLAHCRAETTVTSWVRPTRPTTTTRAPKTTTTAFKPQTDTQKEIVKYLRCLLVFCHVIRNVEKEPDNGCTAGCVDFANRFGDTIEDDWTNEGIYTAVKDRSDCVEACSGLSFLTKADDNKRRCESLCAVKFYYPDWKAYQDELIVVLENLNHSPRLPIY